MRLTNSQKSNLRYAKKRLAHWCKDNGVKHTPSTVDQGKLLVEHGEVSRPDNRIGKNTAIRILLAWNAGNKDISCGPTRPRRKAPKNKKQSPADFLSSWEWRTLRYKVLQEHGRRCMCCGATPDDGVTVIHVDHIKPRHHNPELALERSNLQVLCGVCNQGKGAWDDTDHRDNVIEYDFQCELSTEARKRQ